MAKQHRKSWKTMLCTALLTIFGKGLDSRQMQHKSVINNGQRDGEEKIMFSPLFIEELEVLNKQYVYNFRRVPCWKNN